MRKTMQEILDETIKYYDENLDKISINNEGNCAYYSNGKMCAVGRCLIRPKEIEKAEPGNIRAAFIRGIVSDNDFKPEYQGHSLDFWESLQRIHDLGYTKAGRGRLFNVLYGSITNYIKVNESTINEKSQ